MPSFRTVSDLIRRSVLRRCGEALLRSFIPLLSVLVVGGTLLWGPWVSLALAAGSWRVVKHLA